ncbi:MAG: xanthine dehydrogenase family protein molybdopterin-binding subunit, partial [Acidimicrobiales bacterium]|nr:xanthine dehydrogenase family protein molybdopterin-binding subunit [Acidimicrobiales bacterium]
MSLIGTRVVRKEDPDLLTGAGRYVSDVGPADALHVTFVRSIMPHALITEIDISEAENYPGVVAVHTAASLGLTPKTPSHPLLNQEMTRTWLATDRVRFVGEPVVAIVSDTPAAGVDAAEQV